MDIITKINKNCNLNQDILWIQQISEIWIKSPSILIAYWAGLGKITFKSNALQFYITT